MTGANAPAPAGAARRAGARLPSLAMVRPRRRLAWGALLLLVLAGLAAPQAVLAQDTVTLVSNRHYDGHHIGDSNVHMNLDVDIDATGRGPNTSPRAALRFRTGPNPEGYLLDEFVIWIPSAKSVGSSTGAVYTDDGDGRPVTQIATLSGSPREGLSVLSSASGVALSPDTWYVVRLDFNQAPSTSPDPTVLPDPAQVTLQYMKLGDYVGGSLPGWEISSYYRSWRARNSEWVYRVLRVPFEIRGRVQGTNSAPEFGSARRTIDFRPFEGYARDVGGPVAATDADGDPLAYSLSGADAASFTIDRWSGQIRTRPDAFYGDDTDSAFKIRVTADDRRGGTDTADVSLRPCDPCGAAGAGIPGRPRHLFATVTAGNRIQLNWDPPATENPERPVTGYHVQWAWNASRTNTVSRLAVLAEDTGNTETTYTHTVNLSDLPPDPLFGYRVRAINRSGKGLPSEFVKLTPVVDREAPRTRAARLASDGRRLEITFNEPLRNTDLPDAGQFTVFVDSMETALSPTVWEGTYRHRLRLTLARPVRSDRTVSVSYDAPSSANAIRDLNGNRATDFTLEAVNNSEFGPSSPGVGPSPVSAEVASTGAVISLTFDETIGASFTHFNSYRIIADGAQAQVTNTARNSNDHNILIIFVTPSIRQGQSVTISYTDPTSGDDFQAVQDPDGNDAASFADFPVTNNSEVQNAPPEPLTARFGDLPTRHTGEAFTFELEFGEEFPLTAQTLTSALGVTGGSVTAAEKVNEESSRSWRVTVTPSSAAEAVSVTLAPKESCTEEGAICTADGRTIPAPVEAEVPARAATYITGVEVTSNPGSNGVWDTGETVRVQVAFNAQVGVHGPPGSGPTLGIALDGARREAGYTGGSGTTTLTFEHAVTAADAGATRARVVAKGLNLNGYVIGDTQGQVAGTYFDGAPELSVADAGGAEGTDAAIAFTVTLAPAAATEVTVHYATADGTATAPADYTSTSSMLTFEPGQTSKTVEVPIVDDGQEDDGETFTLVLSDPSGAVLADAEATGTIRDTEAEPVALTAEFLDLPDGGHGANPFTVKLRFSEEFSLSYKTLQNHALGVTNGTLTGVARVTQGEDREWNVTVTPTGGGAVTVALAATTDCAAEGAICAGDGRMLAAVSATVPATAQAPPPTPFRVSAGLPAEHDGTSEIVFEVSFNKRPQADYSYKTLRGETLRIRQGGASLTPKVRRLNKPHNDRWEVTVTPGSKEDLSVSIGPFTSCSDEGAVCTAAGEVLANRIDRTIEGPPGLSVADARVHESVANAAVEFAVTLSRASAATVTVAYATSDGPPPNGATAEDDYASRSGTLTFLAGETAKTVSVPVFADDHDEGEETLILTLSDPTGGAWLKDATAIGTIENTGPMPRAWLARFGRTVASQVIDAVEGRFSASRRPGVEMSLAGRAIGSGSGAGAPEPEDEDARAKAAAEDEARSRLAAMSKWLQGAREDPGSGSGAGFRDGRRAGYESRSVSARDLLTGTSFALTGEAGGAGSGTVSLWGRGAVSRFDGREGDLTLSGEVTSAMLGADWMRPGSGSGAGAWTVGLLVSHSRGEGSYRGADAGTVSSSLTGLYPYGRYMVNERLSVWGVAGYGEGTLTLTPDGQAAMQTAMDLQMGAVGVRGVAVEAPAEGGVELAVTSDAMAVRTASEKTAGLMAAEAEVTRLRLGLEGTWRGIEAGGGELTPRLEVGLRHDGGDAETGFGLDLGGGLSWSHPESGLAAELSGRGLLTHESRGFRDRGLSASFGWDPGRGTGRGPKLTLTQTVGAQASGGMDALLGRETLAGLAATDNGGDDLGNRRLNVGIGYGFAAFGDRFTATPELGLGLSQGRREYSLGWRLGLAQTGPTALELRLQATRSESAGGAVNDNTAEHGIGFTVTARW